MCSKLAFTQSFCPKLQCVSEQGSLQCETETCFSFIGAADLIDELMSTDGEHLNAWFSHASFSVLELSSCLTQHFFVDTPSLHTPSCRLQLQPGRQRGSV